MQNHHNYMKKSISRIRVRCRVRILLLSTMQVSAQPLSKDALTGNVTEVDIQYILQNHFPPA